MRRIAIAAALAGFLSFLPSLPAAVPDLTVRLQPPGRSVPAPDFSIAGGRDSAMLPFELVDDRIFVKVRLNGQGPFNFIFDTGSGAVLRPELARQLGLQPQIAGEGFGAGEKPLLTGTTQVGQVEIGGVRLLNQPFAVMSFADTPQVFGSKPVDGVIGAPVFERLVVSIDYERRQLRLTAPDRCQYRGPGAVIPFALDQDRNLPVVQGQLDGVTGSFGIDTGSRSAVLLYGPFIDRHRLRRKYAPRVAGITGWGFGGPVRSQVARAQRLQLGPVEVRDLIVRLSLQRSGALTSSSLAGLIGPDVLDQFNLVFDYSRRHLIFEKNRRYGIPDSYDRSGMFLGQDGKYFSVLDLTPGGPAAEAGLRVGDKILAIDGRGTDTLLLPDVRSQLRKFPANRQLHLRVQSADGSHSVVLTLRDLV